MTAIKVGARFANYKIVKLLGDGRVIVQCRCGNLRTVKPDHLYVARTEKWRSCIKCRNRVHTVKTPCTNCGRALLRYPSVASVARCGPCRKKRYAKTSLACKARRKKAVLGRICECCGRSDSETNWSTRQSFCSACHRALLRNGLAPCGSPLWRAKVIGGPLICKRHGPNCPGAPVESSGDLLGERP